MNINISSKLLENIIGKIDRFGLARLIKTGQVLEGRVLSVKGNSIIVNFGKGPVMAKTDVKLKRGDFIKVVIKEVKNETLILRLLERKEGIIEKDIEREIAENFPQINREEAKIARSLIKHNIPITKKSINDLKEVVEKESKLKEALQELASSKDTKTKEISRERVKSLLRDMSSGYLIEREKDYELIYIFPYINEERELNFQKIRLKYKKKDKKEQKKEEGENIEFSLNLSQLGPIKIDMLFKRKVIDTNISTTEEEINEFIEKNIERLKEGLQNVGFILEDVRFSILKKEGLEEIDTNYKKIIKGIDIKI